MHYLWFLHSFLRYDYEYNTGIVELWHTFCRIFLMAMALFCGTRFFLRNLLWWLCLMFTLSNFVSWRWRKIWVQILSQSEACSLRKVCLKTSYRFKKIVINESRFPRPDCLYVHLYKQIIFLFECRRTNNEAMSTVYVENYSSRDFYLKNAPY